MAEINKFTETQPQVAQLECLFKAPLVKDSSVALFTDLLKLNPNHNYTHKIVWVREHKTNYYLSDGDGTVGTNWKRIITKAVISRYQSDESYQEGETTYLSGKIYTATQPVPKYYSPLDYPGYWLVISGETVTYRIIFQNVHSVIVYTEIRNPAFQIILGDFELDVEGNNIIDPVTGLAVINNQEIVDVSIRKRDDLVADNGIPYEINFYENSVLSEQLSGCINIK